jgi:hypothetical protein
MTNKLQITNAKLNSFVISIIGFYLFFGAWYLLFKYQQI